jgi:C1A family cysteine protease
MGEILYKLDALQSPGDARDYQAETIFPSDLSLPDEFDPRKELLPIRDQGIQGSCVAEASSAMREIQERKSSIDFEDYLSPQFVYNNRMNQDGSGMYPRDSMNILYKKGILAEEDYPYGKIEKPEQISADILTKASNYKILGYAYVNTIQTMKAAIFRSGACAITVSVYNSGNQMWKPIKPGDIVQGGHAMTAIGWTKEGFIIRNSWGTQWGDEGYTIFPYSDWGMQSEVWTVINDESSKPDPKYSKWYWKTWRAIKNTHINMGPPIVLCWFGIGASIYIGIMDNKWAFCGIPLILAGATIASVVKKLYLVKH